MTPLGDARTHYWLTARAARTCGLDLTEAMQDGLLTHADWADAVTRCRNCPEPAACAAWLDTPEPERTLPGYCRNAALFAGLKELAPAP